MGATRQAWRRAQATSASCSVSCSNLTCGTILRHPAPKPVVHTTPTDRSARPSMGRAARRSHTGREHTFEQPGCAMEYHFVDNVARILQAIQQLPNGKHADVADDRVLATVAVHRIVDSTRRAPQKMGDRDWQALLDAHDAGSSRCGNLLGLVAREGEHFGATASRMVDGPKRAISCAMADFATRCR